MSDRVLPHGTQARWSGQGCRCEACTHAHELWRHARSRERRYVDVTPTGRAITHGYSAYRNHNCRCRDCTEANRVHQNRYNHETGRKRPWDAYQGERRRQVEHGGQTMYRDYGCRCDECKAGASTRRAAERAKAFARPTPDHVHGTVNGYDNYGCRCKECRAARADAVNARRWAKLEERRTCP